MRVSATLGEGLWRGECCCTGPTRLVEGSRGGGRRLKSWLVGRETP